MKKIQIDIDKCFDADERARIKKAVFDSDKKRLKEQAMLDEIDRGLPDYHRPTKQITETRPSLFQREVNKYGFATACYRYVRI